jgi:hypothetical protein
MGAFERLGSYKDYTANTNPTPRPAILRGAVATTLDAAAREGDKSARPGPPDIETADAPDPLVRGPRVSTNCDQGVRTRVVG